MRIPKAVCHSTQARHPRAGFTLLELSIVLIIIAIVVMGGMTVFVSNLQKRQYQDTVNKMNVIRKALYDYRIAMNRIPCPANSPNHGGTSFGLEAFYPGICWGGAVSSDARFATSNGTEIQANTFTSNDGGFHYTLSNIIVGSTTGVFVGDSVRTIMGDCTDVTVESKNANSITLVNWPAGVINCMPIWPNGSNGGFVVPFQFFFHATKLRSSVKGAVPVQTLRLPDEYMFDGWGRKFIYAVDTRLTPSNAFITVGPNDASNRMTVKDSTGAASVTTAAYVLLSTGPNGHGGITNATSIYVSTGSVNADELNNCDCLSNIPYQAGTYDGVFVQKEATQDPATPNRTNDFDDIVTFSTRSDLRSPTE